MEISGKTAIVTDAALGLASHRDARSCRGADGLAVVVAGEEAMRLAGHWPQ